MKYSIIQNGDQYGGLCIVLVQGCDKIAVKDRGIAKFGKTAKKCECVFPRNFLMLWSGAIRKALDNVPAPLKTFNSNQLANTFSLKFIFSCHKVIIYHCNILIE